MLHDLSRKMLLDWLKVKFIAVLLYFYITIETLFNAFPIMFKEICVNMDNVCLSVLCRTPGKCIHIIALNFLSQILAIFNDSKEVNVV